MLPSAVIAGARAAYATWFLTSAKRYVPLTTAETKAFGKYIRKESNANSNIGRRLGTGIKS